EAGDRSRLLHGGWAVAPGARFRLTSPPGIRITISTLRAEETGPLADAVASAVGPSPTRTYV
ncbi:aminotransferase class I/II-fold pyridoxal phosphate-dependent enzyme, partial [Streptomyces sp. NPDC002920]